MDVLRLTFYTAPVSVGILLPFFLMTEFRRLVKYGYAHEPQTTPDGSVHVCGHCSVALQRGELGPVREQAHMSRHAVQSNTSGLKPASLVRAGMQRTLG